MRFLLPALIVLTFLTPSEAQQSKQKPKAGPDTETIVRNVDLNAATYRAISREIWGYAEVGYQETRSSAALQRLLADNGFSIETGVAGMPTAFVATFTQGSGGTTLGFLAEFDALPGLSQDSLFTKKPLAAAPAGHACGHNLFGTGSCAAAIALKDWMIRNRVPGTLKVFGTPAEEGGGAKSYMVRDGLFAGVDAVLHWHPGSVNDASPHSRLAIKQTVFRFSGRSSHAAAAPDAGRSALDGVESMNYMVNLMREHIPQNARIHYVISKGGLAANVVPDLAETEYMVRHPDALVVEEIWNRIVKAAEGAAAGTETTVTYDVVSGAYNMLPNETLSRIMDQNLRRVGGVPYSPADKKFAEELQKTLTGKVPPLAQAQQVEPFQTGVVWPASTDTGDVTWVVPTAGLFVATWVPGVPAHSWQAVSTGGISIGQKAMLNASKVLALTGADLLTRPTLIQQAKNELINRTGPGFSYKAMIGNQKPPVDYRK